MYNLTNLVKNEFYRSIQFYVGSLKRERIHKSMRTFKDLVLSSLEVVSQVSDQSLLLRAIIFGIDFSTIYLNCDKKFTVAQLKVSEVQSVSLYKNLILLRTNLLFSFAKNLLPSSVFVLREKLKGVVNLSSPISLWKIDKFSLFRSYRFFFLTSRRKFLSSLQKKINFVQFNVFFKKYKHNFRVFSV